MTLSSREKKSLRQIAHHIEVVVTIGDQGLSEGVIAETERALADHELIKVRIASGERDDRPDSARSLADQCHAEVVQIIGKVAILYRKNPKADPRLSNLSRYA